MASHSDVTPLALVTAEGTIRAVGSGPDDLTEYMLTGQQISGRALLESAGVSNASAITVVDAAGVGSPNTASDQLLVLHRQLRALADTSSGIVLTHGTNTLEETALFLRMVWDAEVPVVLTGSMRPSSARSADGPHNLRAALATAAALEARHRGVLVAFGTAIFDARSVRKVSGDANDAFSGGAIGQVGSVDLDGRVRFWHPPFDYLPITIPPETRCLPRVEVLTSVSDGDGALTDAAVRAGARGIVIAGSGAGHAADREIAALERARDAGVVVCRASRTGGGSVLPHPLYAGWVAAGRLSAVGARTALQVLLTSTSDAPAVQRRLDRLQWVEAP